MFQLSGTILDNGKSLRCLSRGSYPWWSGAIFDLTYFPKTYANLFQWVGIFCGGFLTAILLAYRVKGAIILGIMLVSIISWPRNTDVTYFPHTPVGDDAFNFFKKVVTFHPIGETLVAQDWNISGVSGQFGLALITFLYVDILDCTGTLYSMARFSGAINVETQDFEGSAVAYLVDGQYFLVSFLFQWSVEAGANIRTCLPGSRCSSSLG